MKKAKKIGYKLFSPWITFNHAALIVGTAFALRALIFFFYIQPHKFYNQPDTPDYHACALSLAAGKGMTHIQTGDPIFWRTPGYPALLAPFYRYFGFGFSLDQCERAHSWALCIQIFLCSLLPLLIGYLVVKTTHSGGAALVSSWWSVFHLGFILSSGFLLSDGVSLLPFTAFLIFLMPYLSSWGARTAYEPLSYKKIIGAAISLAIYTWIRPNGQFASIMTVLLILACGLPWKEKIKKALVFLGIFGACILPWYMRNYTLSREWFFCPMSGPYLQTFCAPKIISRLTQQPLVPAIQSLMVPAFKQWAIEREEGKKEVPIRYVPKELICAQIAWPVIMSHPWWFFCDWLQEVLKSTFDLYSYQLVACAKNTYYCDPPQEFLSEKLAECLYGGVLPFPIRLIAWVELLSMVIIWLSVVGAGIIFVIPFLFGLSQPRSHASYAWHWLQAAFISGGMLWMTGGFGYARLRLPIESLFMIVVTIFVWHAWQEITALLSSRRERLKAKVPLSTIISPE